ncbi:uncharacterized protein GGS22DRAFT_190907 [Annulohypoxylon maeteangense]|uniref:uncharacterized protein n=1 Tax=Annulohypoxylon maeteangense TaxID=1927788 RepID=UPI0020079DDE|nr:uncharacterized protein GGS22DRAFT_190907 [Annulohypoxylon maeteangense]KAI0882930.1 hypothetical protein GGS22DRAFT_190907 [Annulohypoxylon maeteangense]
MAPDPTLEIVESFVLLWISSAIIALRMWVRVAAVGWTGLWADDWIMILVVLTYSALAASTYVALVTCKGLANDDMSPDQRESLDPQGEEYTLRVLGAKIEIVSRVLYTVVLWLTKAAMLAFCRRLTERLGKYKTRIRVGFALLAASWIADFLITMFNCRPFPMNWQVYPDPGPTCYPATAPYGLYGTLSLNIITSLYVFFVPLPILWMANIKLWKKIGLILLVSANCFVIAVAILRAYLILSAHTSGAKQASRWAYRVCFVAVVTTNLPLLFPLLRRLMHPVMKESRSTQQRQIRTITVWERTRERTKMHTRRPSRKEWNAGFCPGLSEDGRLTGLRSNLDAAMFDTGIDVGSSDNVSRSGKPGDQHRETV